MIEKIFFQNRRGDRLCGILSNPASFKVNPIIILCHGFTSSKDSRTNLGLEKILNNNHISTFRFDFFGHGESDGKFEETTISEAVNDIQCALKLVKDSGYRKIGLFGSSFGGMASILAASKSSNLCVLALKSPVSNYLGLLLARNDEEEIKTWKEKGSIDFTTSDGKRYKLNYNFFKDAGKINGYNASKKIKIPTLIVHGDKDETVPLEQSKKTKSLMKNCRLEIIEDGDHVYSKPEDFEKMLDLASEFIIKNLKPKKA